MPHLCIKPQCPNDCSDCNHAIDLADTARVLVFQLLQAWTEDGLKGMVLEDGESALCDRARAFLAGKTPAPSASTVWAVARKDGKLIASTVRQPEPDELPVYDEIWPEWAPHALHEFTLKHENDHGGGAERASESNSRRPANGDPYATAPARPFGTLLCEYGACYPAETHAPGCTEWTPDQVRAAGGKFLDKLPIGF